jgi:hypothetical protein
VAVKKVLKLRSEALQELGGCFGTEDQKGLLSGKLGGPDPVRCSDATTLAFGTLSSYCGPGGVATRDVREKLQEARRGLASWAKRSFCPAGPENEFAESQKAEARRIDDDFQVLSGCLGGEKTAPEDEMSCHRVVDLSGVTSTIVLGTPVFPLSVISLQLRFAWAKKRSSIVLGGTVCPLLVISLQLCPIKLFWCLANRPLHCKPSPRVLEFIEQFRRSSFYCKSEI